ncbi:FAD-dependent monooxygenase [Sphaerisporangium flaviroseum]|uniref:FAD-dependent monooxygenase n=1 Tax=Sphaerisporangium flaviroseum TaxID=509199 RepID=A0ABP7JH23_9ACTN
MSNDVVIAGAGPNGLMLACELSLAGLRPLVIERLPGRTRENRANGLVGQVVRMLDRRGLFERLGGGSSPPRPQPAFVFGALLLNLSLLEEADNPLYALQVPQRRVEQVLEERATELGVEIRRGHELTGLSQEGDGVTVEVTGPTGLYRLRACYLVGADGGRSVVRKLSGIAFPGVTRDDMVSRSAHVSVPPELVDPATGGLDVPGHGAVPPFMHHRTERGLFVYAPFPTGTLVSTTEWEPDSSGGDAPALTLAELRDSVRRVLGADVPLGPPDGEGPHLLRRLAGGSTRVAERFRDRRVLLVGDAAHVHSAIGGPGLNLGLQDAVNLGWKLAAEIQGWAPPGLLDGYEAERRPAAERVVMHTKVQSALIAPGGEVTALRELFAELLAHPDNVRHIAAMMAGADVRYEMGADVRYEMGDEGDPGDAAGGGRALIGGWAPDLTLDTDDGRVRLAELTRGARPLLLDLTADGWPAAESSAWRDRVDVVAARLAGTGGTGHTAPVTALLLRPDCYVAWATATLHPGDHDRAGLRAALSRWFGAPR